MRNIEVIIISWFWRITKGSWTLKPLCELRASSNHLSRLPCALHGGVSSLVCLCKPAQISIAVSYYHHKKKKSRSADEQKQGRAHNQSPPHSQLLNMMKTQLHNPTNVRTKQLCNYQTVQQSPLYKPRHTLCDLFTPVSTPTANPHTAKAIAQE